VFLGFLPLPQVSRVSVDPPRLSGQMINQLIEFEGYRARIERAKDGMLYGKVLGLEEIINFRAPTMRVVERQFIKALESYFERCKQRGIEPEKPATTMGF
jgi:predicted HicB family RNase H-like nuclease